MRSRLYLCETSNILKISLYTIFISLVVFTKAIAEEKNVIQEKIVIVSPYPATFLDGFRRAFENLHPEYDTQILKMKTNSGIEFIKNKKNENSVDLFWASSVDAFEILKSDDLLQPYKSAVQGVPKTIANVPVNDPDNTYSGFAFSGVGLMWNERLLQSKGVPVPTTWEDLAHPQYFDLLGMSSPTRSGTTHVAVEAILQSRGWVKGWQLLQQIGGNLNQITAKSNDVPTGVKEGKFGVGIVIDFYGLTARAGNFPVDFSYPQPAAMFPANIALIKNAPHPKPAKMFIDFLLSLEGQHLLLNKDIRRLPIRMESYSSAPDGYPNPFKKGSIEQTQDLDFMLSKSRYKLVNSIFDNLITFNHERLLYAKSAINLLEEKLQENPDSEAQKLLDKAKDELHWLPADEDQSLDPGYTQKFTKKRKKASDKLPLEQKVIEDEWDKTIRQRYQKALDLANKGLGL